MSLRLQPRIRWPRKGDGPHLLELHRYAFRQRGASTRLGMAQLSHNTVVAELHGRPVGFGCWSFVKEPRREKAIRSLLACLEPDTRSILAPGGDGSDLPLRIEAPDGLQVGLHPRDFVFTALAVHPRYRRHGVGTALARARIQLARHFEAQQVFVHCVAGSGSRRLYERIGFTPLVTKERHYPDGAGMSLLYASL